MKKILFVVSFLIIGFFVSGCTLLNSNLSPVLNTSEQCRDLGVTFLPPQDKSWSRLKRYPMPGTYFAKQINGPMHTAICYVTVTHLREDISDPDEFLKFIEYAKDLDTNPDRFKNIEKRYNLNKRFGDISVDFNLKATDLIRETHKGEFLILKVFGYSFMHPKYPKTIIEIGFSERGTAQEFTSSIEKIGNEFVDNLMIEGGENKY